MTFQACKNGLTKLHQVHKADRN